MISRENRKRQTNPLSTSPGLAHALSQQAVHNPPANLLRAVDAGRGGRRVPSPGAHLSPPGCGRPRRVRAGLPAGHDTGFPAHRRAASRPRPQRTDRFPGPEPCQVPGPSSPRRSPCGKPVPGCPPRQSGRRARRFRLGSHRRSARPPAPPSSVPGWILCTYAEMPRHDKRVQSPKFPAYTPLLFGHILPAPPWGPARQAMESMPAEPLRACSGFGYWQAAFSCSARSVFSHRTPRSSRPMWP